MNSQTKHEGDPPNSERELSQFPVEIDLPSAQESIFRDAKTAVRQEFRDRSRWKRLACQKLSVIAERGSGVIYALQVGSSVEFDWTWEGAVAFRPLALGEKGGGRIDLADFEQSFAEDGIAWSGDILEVDERNGSLFISLTNPESPPTTGPFLVRPFEFLAGLDAVYHEPSFHSVHSELGRRLVATAGGIHPQLSLPSNAGLPDLEKWWRHAWCVLWGPPGTGKTYTTGQQVAKILSDPQERVLVVSTTNRATDLVAISIGSAARQRSWAELEAGQLVRIGKGADFSSFRAAGLQSMLQGTESNTLTQIEGLSRQLRLFDDGEDKALVRRQISDLRAATNDQSKQIFVDRSVRVVVATLFKAMQLLVDPPVQRIVEQSAAPFTTIVIDEAGLVSRAAVAALSLLASRRIVLVGDSKQLAPISRIARVLPTRQETWLAKSGVSHLHQIRATPTAVHVLTEQYRMHPQVCRVVSHYQYDNVLTTAPDVTSRPSTLPELLASAPRAIWYVLDDETPDSESLRAERAMGHRSWVRPITRTILSKLFDHTSLQESNGLFISPYKGQAQAIAKYLTARKLVRWQASTVHSQQGSEADVVIFDTVNAGSCSWPIEEWRRLVNVAISRARECVIVLASRSEMDEPYLRPLASSLTPLVLERRDGQLIWKQVAGLEARNVTEPPHDSADHLGAQIARRKRLKPVLSHEQQRLTNLELDGKPRLVRGVAGSGKTLVLSNWLAKTAQRKASTPDARIWAVYANRSLHKLLQNSIEASWQDIGNRSHFPWEKVTLLHVRDVLMVLLPMVGLSMDSFGFDYNKAAEAFLNQQSSDSLLPHCDSLFIDEAQDMGSHTLRLLLALVRQTTPEDKNSRSVSIFFDNAQNLYGCQTPSWSQFGLNMRGRSTIMKESFRSTNPITELAVNVLHRLAASPQMHDHQELLALGLLQRTERNGQEWLQVQYNRVAGPKPLFRIFENRRQELETIGRDLIYLIREEGIAATDICIIYNGKSVAERLCAVLSPILAEIGVELVVEANRFSERRANTILVTTCHSYKGYEAEVVIIPCADRFTTKSGEILAATLYVAMTRSRSLLAIYTTSDLAPAAQRLNQTLQACVDGLNATAVIDAEDAITAPGSMATDVIPSLGPDGHGPSFATSSAFGREPKDV